MTVSSTARLTGVAPILLVKDVRTSVAYYVDKLGFSCDPLTGDPPEFAILERDGMRVFLQLAADPAHVVPHWTVSPYMWNIYFWCDDPDALFEELTARGAIIDYGIGNKDYGCREFGVRDLDDYDIAFGKPLRLYDKPPMDER